MKYFTLVLLLLCCISCFQPDRNCTDFKTGTFTYEVSLNDETIKGSFTRTEDLQIENYGEGKIDSSRINWVNDCEFIAKKIHPQTMNEKKPLLFKILYTEGDSYTFEYSYVDDMTNKHQGKVYKK
ncbi:hypothetical protein SAMN05216480_11613 [Pustulibacterium marinum]|uniref:DNA topoisomerase IV n=1 Tax=Pustulibacterium marinum TaxID=1224947 RepID=A0A1I7IG51_9FLAO|nr:hypothetical protein [Pustulibacterium marinum]SFU71911.1 hypothetical protein SAMN05216480_11613 [Pustulibacterium marinum]